MRLTGSSGTASVRRYQDSLWPLLNSFLPQESIWTQFVNAAIAYGFVIFTLVFTPLWDLEADDYLLLSNIMFEYSPYIHKYSWNDSFQCFMYPYQDCIFWFQSSISAGFWHCIKKLRKLLTSREDEVHGYETNNSRLWQTPCSLVQLITCPYIFILKGFVPFRGFRS